MICVFIVQKRFTTPSVYFYSNQLGFSDTNKGKIIQRYAHLAHHIWYSYVNITADTAATGP